jgi:hypothetical protein
MSPPKRTLLTARKSVNFERFFMVDLTRKDRLWAGRNRGERVIQPAILILSVISGTEKDKTQREMKGFEYVSARKSSRAI